MWLNLMLNRPIIDPEKTATILEIVTNWLAVANENGSAEPKNVIARSIRNIPVRDSMIHVEKKAKVKDGTKRFPAVDFLFAVSNYLNFLRIFLKTCLNNDKEIIERYRINNLSN